MAAADRIWVRVNGRGGHGAMPHLAIDPVVAAGGGGDRAAAAGVARDVANDVRCRGQLLSLILVCAQWRRLEEAELGRERGMTKRKVEGLLWSCSHFGQRCSQAATARLAPDVASRRPLRLLLSFHTGARPNTIPDVQI